MTEYTRAEKQPEVASVSGMLGLVRKQVIETLGNITEGSLTVTDPLGTFVCGPQQTDLAITITIRDLDFYRAVAMEGSNGI
mgnify:CR=1 FL=1